MGPQRLPRRSFLGLLGAAGAGVGLGGGLTACGTDATSSGGDDSFQVWVLQEENQQVAHKGSVDRFNARSDVDARLVATPNDGYTDKLHVSMGSANKPDVFYN